MDWCCLFDTLYFVFLMSLISKQRSIIKSNVEDVRLVNAVSWKGLRLIKHGMVAEGRNKLYNTVNMAVTFMETNKGECSVSFIM